MSQHLLDKPMPVRPGEELPIEKIDAWLKQQIAGLSGTPVVTQYTGGASNWTYRLQYPEHDWVLRCPPKGTKAASAHDMAREYHIQKALMPYYPVPRMVAFCDDHSVMGCDFYVMEHVKGIILRKNLPKGLTLTRGQTRQLCMQVLETLIRLHTIDIEKTGLSRFGKGVGYVQRQIDGWTYRYQKARTWNVPRCTFVMQWLKHNMPKQERLCLIHNDFRLDNIVLSPDDPLKIIGVLDWEMATIGDPLMDLGNSLAYWVQADDDFLNKKMRRQPTHLPGMFTRQEVIAYYCDRMGFNPADFTFYQVYGLFRLAVIAQQIYYRYFHRQTRNPAFRHFWIMVHYLNWRCRRLIKEKR
ncbi:MAG: aminoglycoside phosphotransferase [Chitinophagales bacterium]|nr:MAG: aminoglycoside phosphotransferase [Chitinophagales bacterium]